MKDRVLEFLAVRQLRAQQLAEEIGQTGEFPVAKLQGEQGRRHAVARQGRRERRPADHRQAARPRRARWPRGRSCCSSARRASARRRSPSRSRASLGREYVRVVARRRARRGRHPRPPPHLRRRDARAHHPGDEAGGHEEPGLPARRSRQARRLVPGRPVERAARGARSRRRTTRSPITTSACRST